MAAVTIYSDFPGCLDYTKGSIHTSLTTLSLLQLFDIVNKAEIDVFLELSCLFDDPADVGNLTSGSSAFSKTSLNIWKFMYC